MYVQIPIFSGYANIAICPGHGTVCYMMDNVEKNQNLYSEMNPKSYTFLPFYANHHYILYPTSDDKMDDGVVYFYSEKVMKEHILGHLETEYVTGRSLSVTVSTVAAPSVTTPQADCFEQFQEIDNVSSDYNKVEKQKNKLKKIQKTKKNKKKNKITLNDDTSPMDDGSNDSWNTVNFKKSKKIQKKLKTQKYNNEQILQNKFSQNKFSLLKDDKDPKEDFHESKSTILQCTSTIATKQSRLGFNKNIWE